MKTLRLLYHAAAEIFLFGCVLWLVTRYGGWNWLVALFWLVGVVYRFYHWVRQARPKPPLFQYGRTIYDRNSDGSRSYPY